MYDYNQREARGVTNLSDNPEDLERVNELLDEGKDPTDNDYEMFHDAVEEGQLNVVNRLLDDPRVDPSVLDNYALDRAVYLGFTKIVELLLGDKRVGDVKGDYEDPTDGGLLSSAVEYEYYDIFDLLIKDKRFDPSSKNYSALNTALNVKDRKFSDDLLQKINLVDLFNTGLKSTNKHLKYYLNVGLKSGRIDISGYPDFFNMNEYKFLELHDTILGVIQIANGVEPPDPNLKIELSSKRSSIESEVQMLIKMLCNFCQNTDYMLQVFQHLDEMFDFVNPSGQEVSVFDFCGRLPEYSMGGLKYLEAEEDFYKHVAQQKSS